MKVIVTTGPSFEPIDEVRRLTNFSSGETGVLLAERLASARHEVFCLKGTGATWRDPQGCHLVPFTTNDNLYEHLLQIARNHVVDAVYHVAALCDFKIKVVTDAEGKALSTAKLDSRAGGVRLELEPGRKVIRELRALFPGASVVGWKYELAGTRAEALEKAWSQLKDNRTDACVLNGRAYGVGFAFCTRPDSVIDIAGKEELADFLSRWLERDKATVG